LTSSASSFPRQNDAPPLGNEKVPSGKDAMRAAIGKVPDEKASFPRIIERPLDGDETMLEHREQRPDNPCANLEEKWSELRGIGRVIEDK
jgi:hypothetical protein